MIFSCSFASHNKRVSASRVHSPENQLFQPRMVLGVGVDLVHVARIQRLEVRFGRRFLNKFLTRREVEAFSKWDKGSGGAAHFLASRWASKEAVFKALGPCKPRIEFTEIEVISNGLEAPLVRLSGKAERQANEKGVAKILLSISHDSEFAVANAIAV